MRLSSSSARVAVRVPCKAPRAGCRAVVRSRVQQVERRDVRAWFFKIGGKSGEQEAYGTASVSLR